MKLLVTCFKGTAPTLSQELKILGYKTFDNFPTGMYVEGNMEDIYKINLESRIGNKVYLEVANGNTNNFDELFDLVNHIEREKYISKGHKISVSTNIFHSEINSNKSAQSIINKAIIKNLVGDNKQRMSDPKKEQVGIFVQISENKCSVFVNTTGEGLHNRLYRKEAGEAPLKENIAASLIRICNWHFKHTLLDPMCGSGTICIEAAMIAKNIAPGLNRNFMFENFLDFDVNLFEEIKNKLQSKIFKGNYDIVGYDIDQNMVNIAIDNAKRAGVDDTISFEKKDISDIDGDNGFVISNPPYGKRLESNNMHEIYDKLISLYDSGTKGCFISSWKDVDRMIGYDFKIKNLNNNGEEVKIYLKK